MPCQNAIAGTAGLAELIQVHDEPRVDPAPTSRAPNRERLLDWP